MRMTRSRAATGGSDRGATQRMTPARWTDRRLWAGLALLLASALAGGLLLSRPDGTVAVWRATRDLSVGASLADLEPVRVAADLAPAYAAPGDVLDGVLRTPVRAGELVPVGAVVAPTRQPGRRVTLPVDPVHAPSALMAGDRVDVWSTPRAAGDASASGEPRLVLASAAVSSVSADVGLTGEVAVEVEVPTDQVAAVVAAARAGVIDLVAVPVDAQEPRA